MQNKPHSLISLDHISYQIGNRRILDDVSFDIHQNEILTIIGPNGAGKSTLLKIILELITATKGTIHRKDTLKIGYMPQKMHIDTTLPLSVKRFLSLGANKHDILETLELVKAQPLLNRSMHVLSGGEFQRVLLAKALLQSPDLLVLDEPGQGVDVIGLAELYKLIKTVSKTLKCGIVIVSHDLHFVHGASDRVICLNQHICCAGTPQDIGQDPAFHHLYGDALPAEIARYHHSHDHSHDCHLDQK